MSTLLKAGMKSTKERVALRSAFGEAQQLEADSRKLRMAIEACCCSLVSGVGSGLLRPKTLAVRRS